MLTDFCQPCPGDWVNSESGRPIGRVVKVDAERMQIVDVDNEILHVDLAHISTVVDRVLVVDSELRSLRALQHP